MFTTVVAIESLETAHVPRSERGLMDRDFMRTVTCNGRSGAISPGNRMVGSAAMVTLPVVRFSYPDDQRLITRVGHSITR